MIIFLRKYFLPFISWSIIILILSTMPTTQLPKVEIINFDKVVHLMMYAILEITLLWSLLTKQNFQRKYLVAICMAAAYGFLMECVQGLFCSYRSFEWADAAANAAGALTGAGLVKVWLSRLKLFS